MSKIDALRKILREEIALVLRQELPKLLQESKSDTQFRESLKKQVSQKIPGTLNERTKAVSPPILKKGNILNDMLAETAMNMNQRDAGFIENSEVNGFSAIQNYEASSVSDVNSMLASSMPSAAHEMVQINAVPDFNNLMDKMINKGAI